jgi:benzoylformate decarboxylase
VPTGCQVFQLSSDMRDLGRTTELSCTGDIKASLAVLLPMLDRTLARHRDAIAALREKAASDQQTRRAAPRDRAVAEAVAPMTTPFVAAAEVVRAARPHVAIVDEAPATMVSVRSLLESSSPRQYSACRRGGLGWGMPAGQNERNALLVRISGNCNVRRPEYSAITGGYRFSLGTVH